MTQHALVSPHDALRHESVCARAARQADAHGAARERGDQRDLDRRSRPLRLRGHVFGGSRHAADAAHRRRAAAGRLGGRADRGGGGLAEKAVRRTAAPRPGFWPRRRRPPRSCICWRESRAASAAPTSIIACGSSISARRNARRQPGLGLAIAEVERLQGVLVVGSNLRHEMPLLAHRSARPRSRRRKGRLPQSAPFRVFVSGRRLRRCRRDWCASSPRWCARRRRERRGAAAGCRRRGRRDAPLRSRRRC
jgi:hypothetical protein